MSYFIDICKFALENTISLILFLLFIVSLYAIEDLYNYIKGKIERMTKKKDETTRRDKWNIF